MGLRVLCVGSAYGHVPRRVAAVMDLGHETLLLAEHDRIDSPVQIVVPGVFLHPSRFGRLRLPWQIAVAIKRFAPVLIHAHSAATGSAGVAAALSSRPLIVSTMGGDIFFDNLGLSPSRRLLARALLCGADAVTAKSDAMIEKLHALGVAPERLHVVNWGVDPGVFRPISQLDARARLGLPAHVPLILSSRAMDPLYNIDLIVDAFRNVARELPSSRLVLVEAAPDVAYTSRIREKIDMLGLSRRVHWLPELSFDSMPCLYSAADLLVSVPRQDAVPQTLLEAMACETACIVGDLTSVRSFVTHGRQAWLTAMNSTAVANAILLLIRDPERRARLGQKGREYVVAHAAAGASIAAVERLYRQLGSLLQRPSRGLVRRAEMLALWLVGPLLDRLVRSSNGEV